MRISSREIQLVGLNSMLDQQDKLSKTQQQVASGNRILRPSDDPVATTQILKLRQSVDTTKRYQDNAGAARDRLGLEEGVLQGVTNSLQRVRELVVKANDGVQTTETRSYIAAEVRQRLGEMLGLANTQDGNGDYLFAGGKGGTTPFALSAGSYVYQGDQTDRKIQIGSDRTIADGNHGLDVFGFEKGGAIENVFNTLSDLADALETESGGTLQTSLTNGLTDIDAAMTNMLVVRSSVGTRLNAIDGQQTVNDDSKLQMKEVLSSLQDLDYADAVTRLNLQMAGLDAAQKAYMKVQGLSMFNYLKI